MSGAIGVKCYRYNNLQYQNAPRIGEVLELLSQDKNGKTEQNHVTCFQSQMWIFSKNRMVYYKIRIDTNHSSKVEQSNSLEQLTYRLSFNHLWITQVMKS